MRPLSKAFRRYPKGTALFLGLILYALAVASTHADDNSMAESIAEWDFGAREDVRRDGWPDSWIRRTGPDYPKFLPIAIHQNARSADDLVGIESFRRISSQFHVSWQQSKWPWQVIPEKVPPAIDTFLERTLLNPYLRIQMDGGSAEITSPVVPIDIHSMYFMTASIHSDSTDYEAVVKLRFLNSSRKVLFEMPSKTYSGKTAWSSASTDSQYPFRDDLAFVQVVFQVLPKSIKAYRGDFGLDAIRIFRTPRLSLSADKPLAYYRQGEEVVVRCTASGMSSDQSKIELSLIDHTGREVNSVKMDLVRQEAQQNRVVSKGESETKTGLKSYWDGSCEWRLTDLPPGYYEIRTQLSKGKSGVFKLDEQFVVLPEDIPRKSDSRFGWTMSTKRKDGLETIDTSRLVEILRHGHVGRIKIPIWFDSQDTISSKSAIERVDRIQLSGVGCVGVIASPPVSLHSKFARLIPNETGSALEDSLLVTSFLEPVMRPMCARISDFQIGWDHEIDFISNPRITQALNSIKNLAGRYGQETQLIAARSPMFSTPPVTTIDRWQLYSTQPLTAVETESLVGKNGESEKSSRVPWMSITPIHAQDYSLSVRVQDLVSRMVLSTKDPGTHGTTAWVSNPADPEVGMLDSDGGPREMFLPFRSTAAALSGMRLIGSLPNQLIGENHLIANGDLARLIVWSARPMHAKLYLGEDVSARDIWGRSVPVETLKTENGPEQRIAIDKWPIIIDGIDVRVARWRMGVGLQETRIDPLVGKTQEMKVRFANPLSVPVVGKVKVIAPFLMASETTSGFEIEGNTSDVINVPIQIRPDANTTAASVKLKFSIQGDKPVTFVVDQEMQVGTSDFEFEPRYEFDAEDRLRLFIEVINHESNPLNFDCLLLIPDRARERTQIAGLKDRVTKLIVLENASDLIGKTLWLRCEQIATNRILNYRIEINR